MMMIYMNTCIHDKNCSLEAVNLATCVLAHERMHVHACIHARTHACMNIHTDETHEHVHTHMRWIIDEHEHIQKNT